MIVPRVTDLAVLVIAVTPARVSTLGASNTSLVTSTRTRPQNPGKGCGRGLIQWGSVPCAAAPEWIRWTKTTWLLGPAATGRGYLAVSLAANGGTAPSDTRTPKLLRLLSWLAWLVLHRQPVQWAGCPGMCAVDLLIARGDHPHSET